MRRVLTRRLSPIPRGQTSSDAAYRTASLLPDERPGHACVRTIGAGRRRPPVLGADRDPGPERVQAALLWLGPRIRVVAHAPPPVLRGAVSVLHRDPRRRQRRAALRRLPTDRHRAVELLRRGDRQRGRVPGDARAAAAQDPLPAHGHPIVGVADSHLQPRDEHDRRVRVRGAQRARPPGELARARSRSRWRCVVFATGIGMLLSRRLRPLPRRGADLGGPRPSLVLPHAHHVRGLSLHPACRGRSLRSRARPHRDDQSSRAAVHPDGPRTSSAAPASLRR